MLLPTVRVMVEVPAPGAGIVTGLKLTVVPVGIGDADKVIPLLKPLMREVVMVEVPCFPCATLREAGEGDRVKSGAKVTVTETTVVWYCPPPDAVTVIG